MSTEIEEGKNDQTIQDEELARLSVIVQVFGDDGEGNVDEVSSDVGEISGEDEGGTKAVWRASAAQLQSPDDVSDLVKDIRDKISARLVAKREAAFRAACEQVELDFPIPDTNGKDGKVSETASKASITKKSVTKKKKKKKKKNPVAEAQRKRQEALDAVPRPLKPVFAVRGLAFPGAFDEKRAKEEITLESPWALAALYQEWRAVHSQRKELLTMRAFRDLLDILARHGTMTDTILFEVFQLLQNESLERFAWDPLCAFIRTLAKRRPSRADSYEVNRYLGLAAWAVARHVDALRDSISKERSPMTSIVPALKAADSLRSSKPTTEALYYVCAAAALSSFVEEDEYCRSTEALGCFADLGRRANDGVVLLGSLVILNNTLAAYIKSDKISDDAKRAILTKVTNHFASPQLIVHDVETKGSLARTDLSTIVLASSAVTKACTDLPLHVSADLLCRSGALRRILALANWAYQGLIISAATAEGEEEQLEALGDFVVPGSAAVLSSYVTQLRKVCSLEDKEVDSRPTIVRVALLQTIFLLSTAVWNIQDQMELTAPNQALFLELAKLFCKTANMVRLEWVVISEAKNAERALKARAAEEAAELAALRALETGQPAQGNGAEMDDDPATSSANGDACEIHVEEHPLEWILGDTERCALVGLRSLLEARYISAEDIAEHLLPNHLSHIAAFLECITPQARQCSIDVLNRFLIAFEEMKDAKRAKAHLCEVTSGVEPVLVVDTLLAHPNEDNVAFLLCRVMKYTPDVAAAEILSNVLTLIDHRTMFISAHKGRQEAADLLIVTYLLEVVQHAAECPSRRRLMGTSEGGSAVEVLLASLSRLLALPGRPFHVHECVVHVCMALTLILQDVQNAETFVDARGVQMLCAMVEEFASASAHVHPGPEKASHYEVLIHALKLWRVIIMTRSVHFQRATLSAEVMDTLFTTCCAPYEEDLPQYLKSAAQSKRLAASILAALPFKREVSEPALIAVARRFICQDYRQCLCIAVEQQSFGAQLFSRVEISETGHELLRRSKVVKSLVQFACHEAPADASPADRASNDARKQSALIGLLYLCAEDAKTQVYVCTTALYRLLKLAWTSQQANFQHALVGRLLEQLALNKLNRTKLFKAEMRARAVAHRAHVGHYASEEEKAAFDAMTSMRRNEARSQEKEEHLDAYDSFEEASAAGELHELIRLRHEYSQWLDKETGKKPKKYALKQKLKVVPGADAGSPRQQQQQQHQQQQQQQQQNGNHARNKSPTRIPALERPDEGKSHPPRETLESSKLWVFKDSILTPQANLSSVASSNGRSPRDTPVGGLFQALNQPMKLLWTNRGIVEALEVSREIPLREGAPLGTLKTDKLWQFKESADPFQALVSRIPVPAYIADMDVPDLAFLREARGSMLAPTLAEINDLDNEDAASAVVSPVSLKYWVPGICCLGVPPHPAAVVRPRTGFGAEKWVSRVKQLKSWDVDGSLVPLPVDLRVRDIAAISIVEEGQTAVADEPAATLETFRDKHYETIVRNALTGVDVDCALDALCPLFLYYSARPTLDVRSLFEDIGLEPLAKKDTTPKTLASFLDIVRLRLESGTKTAQNIADSLWSKFGEKDLNLLFAWERQKARLAPILRDHSPLLQSIGGPGKLCSALEMAGTIPEEDLQLARAMASPFAEVGVDATAAVDIDVDVDAAIGVALCWLAPALVKEPIRLYDDAQIIAQEEKRAAAKRGRRAQEQAQSDQDDKAKEEEQNVPLMRALRLLLAHLYQAHNPQIEDTSA